MWFDSIPESTMIAAPECEEQWYDGGETAVLLIHGYTGSPHDMIYLGKRLNKAGYTVYIPRLPGHGTNHMDFLNSGWNDWLRRCVDAYLLLKRKFRTVYISGLSMGGVLTLLIASKFNPKKIALAAPAIETSNNAIKLTPVIRYFKKAMPKGGKVSYDEEYLNYLQSEYWCNNWPTKLADLLKLQNLSKERLNLVRSDCLIIVSEKDETVPLKAAEIIDKGINSSIKKTVVLKNSPHVVVNDCEKEKVADEIITWFNE
ncbi:MAG TPA: alpha/beta fold hydrolase [Thermotogota bacterium]|nr:alpha/beta fold hydrolase [Thermotogota bacterium]